MRCDSSYQLDLYNLLTKEPLKTHVDNISRDDFIYNAVSQSNGSLLKRKGSKPFEGSRFTIAPWLDYNEVYIKFKSSELKKMRKEQDETENKKLCYKMNYLDLLKRKGFSDEWIKRNIEDSTADYDTKY